MPQSRRIHMLALNAMGATASLASFLYGSLNLGPQPVLVAVTSGAALTAFSSLFIRHWTSLEVECRMVEFSLEIGDKDGKHAVLKKTVTFVPKTSNVSTVTDRHITASGQIVDLRSNVGSLSDPFDEGGSLSIVTNFPTCLPKGQEITRTLTIESEDSFTESRESLSAIVQQACKKLKLRIRTPKSRPIQRYFVQVYRNGHTVEETPIQLQRATTDVQYEIRRPSVGTRYLLTFDW